MKKLTQLSLALAVIWTIAATSALGQTNQIWTLDENGPALLSGPISGYSNGSYQFDPQSGLTGWYYSLGGPGANVPGDLMLLEPGTGAYSDLLRFDGAGVFFFSDLEAGELNPDMADVSILPNPNNPVILTEIGPEGNNGVLYTPGPTDPGFDLTGLLPGLQYNIISDIPEPSTIALAGLGVAVLIVFRRRR
jgi:hypothetical protein